MGIELHEPVITERRGDFHRPYALDKNRPYQPASEGRTPRLMDHVMAVVASEDPDYMTDPAPGEFAVVDVVTKEKAFFEMPYGATPEIVTGMVSSHFAANAVRVGEKLWFV